MYLRMYSLERVAVRVRVFNMVGYESNVVYDSTCVRQELRRVDRKSSKGVEEDKIHIYATDANGSLYNVSSLLVKI